MQWMAVNGMMITGRNGCSRPGRAGSAWRVALWVSNIDMLLTSLLIENGWVTRAAEGVDQVNCLTGPGNRLYIKVAPQSVA